MTPTELKHWRQRHEISQARLARLVRVKANTVHRWESGTRKVPEWLPAMLTLLSQRFKQTRRS